MELLADCLVQMTVEAGVADLSRRYQLLVSDFHRMDRALDLGYPEIEELEEPWIVRRDVVELPDETLEQPRTVRQVVEDIRRGEAITAGFLAQKHGSEVKLTHVSPL